MQLLLFLGPIASGKLVRMSRWNCTIAHTIIDRWLSSSFIELSDPAQRCCVVQGIIRMWTLQLLQLFWG